MEQKFYDWTTTYKYGIGTVNQIRTGELETHLLEGNEDFLGLLSQGIGVIAIPKILGIYQYETPKKESASKRKERLKVEEKFAELQLLQMEDAFRIQERCHPKLIYAAYLEPILAGMIHTALQDASRRIKVSKIEKLPDFFHKDIYTFHTLVNKAGTLLEAKGEQRAGEIFREMEPEFRALTEHYSQFGFTRTEWTMICLNYPKFFSITSSLPDLN